jgi:hypothetical protein
VHQSPSLVVVHEFHPETGTCKCIWESICVGFHLNPCVDVMTLLTLNYFAMKLEKTKAVAEESATIAGWPL